MVGKHPSEVRSTLQRYYCINLDDVDAGLVSVFQAAACLADVPMGSALARVLDVRATWSNEAFLLHSIWQSLVGEEIPYPWDKHKSGLGNESMGVDEFMEWYQQNWEDDDEWQTL